MMQPVGMGAQRQCRGICAQRRFSITDYERDRVVVSKRAQTPVGRVATWRGYWPDRATFDAARGHRPSDRVRYALLSRRPDLEPGGRRTVPVTNPLASFHAVGPYARARRNSLADGVMGSCEAHGLCL